MNQDGTEVQQLDNITPQSSGICIRTPAQAKAWISEAQTMSSDELGMLILGTLPTSTTLPTQPVTFQFLNAAHQKVLLHGHLVQLGSKMITCKFVIPAMPIGHLDHVQNGLSRTGVESSGESSVKKSSLLKE